MAAGDVKDAYGNGIAQNAFHSIRPGAGEEWVLTNIFYSGSVEMYFRDESVPDEILFMSDTSVGATLGLNIHMTNNFYVRVKAIGAARDIAHTAVQTK